VIVKLRNHTQRPFTYSYEGNDYDLAPGDLRWVIALDSLTIKDPGSTATVPFPSRFTRDDVNVVIADEVTDTTHLQLVDGSFYKGGKPIDIATYVRNNGVVYFWIFMSFFVSILLFIGVMLYAGVSRSTVLKAHF
jgi:hypothetical protein